MLDLMDRASFLVEGAFFVYEFGQQVGTLGLKLVTTLWLWYYGNWKLACCFYLLSNIIGSATLFYYFFRVSWFLLRYSMVDSWLASGVVLVLFVLHELRLISVPKIFWFVSRKLSSFLHRLLDVTGDGQFDYEDVAVIATKLVNCISPTPRKVNTGSPAGAEGKELLVVGGSAVERGLRATKGGGSASSFKAHSSTASGSGSTTEGGATSSSASSSCDDDENDNNASCEGAFDRERKKDVQATSPSRRKNTNLLSCVMR
ncbi:unnamed protein product [Amoebophrya sp. A120]|nr:unnamed protein product [Amoebophrya sp. A120]|eukprot:GSA120T00002184001.1